MDVFINCIISPKPTELNELLESNETIAATNQSQDMNSNGNKCNSPRRYVKHKKYITIIY